MICECGCVVLQVFFSSLGEYIQMEDIVYNLLNWQSADLTILACAEIIYQLFSPISPLPRILHTTQKQPFIMAHLNTYNLQHYKLKNFTVSLGLLTTRMERKVKC